MEEECEPEITQVCTKVPKTIEHKKFERTCTTVTIEKCQSICNDVKIAGKTVLTGCKNISKNDCKNEIKEMCHNSTSDVTKEETVDSDCKDVQTTKCVEVKVERCVKTKVCKNIDKEVTVVEKQSKCENVNVVRCHYVVDKVCKEVPMKVKSEVVRKRCQDVCQTKTKCEKKPKMNCKSIFI